MRADERGHEYYLPETFLNWRAPNALQSIARNAELPPELSADPGSPGVGKAPMKISIALLFLLSACATKDRMSKTQTPEDRGLRDVRHISVSIARSPSDVYEFASDPRNLPKWAAGLARSEVKEEAGEWVADAPFGKVRIRFAPRNELGVMDHDVTLESGAVVHNPMRVVPNGQGTEFIFTVIRQAGMSDEQFEKDQAAVRKDLRTLKALLERK